MFEISGQIYFDTLTEAKMALLTRALNAPCPEPDKASAVEMLKQSIEQHDDKEMVLARIQTIRNETLLHWLQPTVDCLQRSLFDILPAQHLNEHPLIGGFETFISANLFSNPTDAMTAARNKVSAVILETLEYYRQNQFTRDGICFRDAFEIFARYMIFEFDHTYIGTFPLALVNSKLAEEGENVISTELNSLNEKQMQLILDLVMDRLRSPDSQHHEIMAIHTMFSEKTLKKVPLIVSDDSLPEPGNPVFDTILQEYSSQHDPIELSTFFASMRLSDEAGNTFRRFVSDAMMYKKPFYWFEPDRGRGKPEFSRTTSTLGVMRCKLPSMQEKLPRITPPGPLRTDWTTCHVSCSSKMVAAFMRHETPFISSYSGTASLGANLMIATNALKTLEEQQIYFSNFVGYITGSGFHSLHEVLAPVVYCLNLWPRTDYPIDDLTSPETYHAPQYHSYFQLMAAIDPQFATLRTQAWEQYLDWYDSVYIPNAQNMPFNDIISTLIQHFLHNPDRKFKDYLHTLLSFPLEPEFAETFEHLMATLYHRHRTVLLTVFPKTQPDVSGSRGITAYQRAAQLIQHYVAINTGFQKLCDRYPGFQFLYDGNQLRVITESQQQGPYCLTGQPLSLLSNSIEEALAGIKVSPDAIASILETINASPKASYLIFTDRAIIDPIIEIAAKHDLLVHTPFNWQTFVTTRIDQGDIKILKQDSARQHLVYYDENLGRVHKITAIKTNLQHELRSLNKQKTMFEFINKRTITIKNGVHYVETIMPCLGESLNEQRTSLRAEQWQSIKTQALKLVSSLHQKGYVHGDISPDNFLYDSKDDRLYLIDFETAKRRKPDSTAVKLRLFSTHLRASSVDPEHYTVADELRMVNEMFDRICPESGVAASSSPVV